MTVPNNAFFDQFASAFAEAVKTKLNEGTFSEILAEHVRNHITQYVTENPSLTTRTIQLKFPNQSRSTTTIDDAHHQLATALNYIAEGHNNIMLTGPAGCGKTTLASHLAKSLSLPFGFISLTAGVSEPHLIGRIMPLHDGSWGYVPSAFVNIFKSGGVFLLDEYDAADENVMLTLNSALANGTISLPDGTIAQRSPDTYVIAASNTYGLGNTALYVARNRQDAAALDRFTLAIIKMDYDTTLERSILSSVLKNPSQEKEIYDWITSIRTIIADNQIQRVASTRLVVSAAMAARNGATLDEIKARYLITWSEEEKAHL